MEVFAISLAMRKQIYSTGAKKIEASFGGCWIYNTNNQLLPHPIRRDPELGTDTALVIQ